MDTKQTREKRGELIVAMRKINDQAGNEKRDLTKEENASWDEMDADFNKLGRDLERADKLAEMDVSIANTGNDPGGMIGRHDQTGHPAGQEPSTGHDQPDHLSHNGRHGNPDSPTNGHSRAQLENLTLQGWMLNQSGRAVEQPHIDAARTCGVNLNSRELEVSLLRGPDLDEFMRRRQQSRVMGTVPLDQGGVLIASELVTSIEMALLDFSGVRQVAKILRTARGGSLTYPTVDDTANKGERLAEGKTVTDLDIKPGAIVLQDYKYSSKNVLINVELLTDSAISLPPLIGQMLGERIGRITNDEFTTGTGASQPKGIVTASTLGVTTESTTAIASDELFDLIHTVDPAYRASNFNVGWMMHDSILKVVRKLKDSNNQYLWNPALTTGVPTQLLGYPVTINQSMDSAVTATKTVMLFGALQKYIIRDIATLRLRRLVERYADNDQEAFLAFSRHDGNLLDAGVAPVKHLIMKA